MFRRREIAQHVGLRAAGFFLKLLTFTSMSIRLRLTGSVSDAPRSLTFTRSGAPRFSFTVRVGGLRKRSYRVTAYGSIARFGERHLHVGDRVQIEGAYLRRSRTIEADVRGDTIRHVGKASPPEQHVTMPERFVPPRPHVPDASGDTFHALRHAHDAEYGQTSDDVIDAALAAAVM